MKKIKTNLDFVNYLKTLLNRNTVYMWDGYGTLVTNDFIKQKASIYPRYYSKKTIKLLKTLVNKNYYSYDCAGMIKSYWMSDLGTKEVVYNHEYDKDSYEITIEIASDMGSLKSMPEIKGLFLYMKGHCGVYIGSGQVIECTSNETISHKDGGGVCVTSLKERPWSTWTKCKWLNYINDI